MEEGTSGLSGMVSSLQPCDTVTRSNKQNRKVVLNQLANILFCNEISMHIG